MDEYQFHDSSIQVGFPMKKRRQPTKKFGKIYQNRRDCLAIKKRLMKYVNQEEYTKVIIAYFHGLISKSMYDEKMKLILNNPCSKILHNQLMRSILFNAHFSMEEPPNIEHIHYQENRNSFEKAFYCELSAFKPDIKPQTHNIKPIMSFFNSLNISDLRKIPSQNLFSSRMENIALQKKLNSIDEESIAMVYNELKKYLLLLLDSIVQSQRGKEPTSNEKSTLSDIKIKASDILQTIKSNEYFSSVVSLSLLSKYSSLTTPQ